MIHFFPLIYHPLNAKFWVRNLGFCFLFCLHNRYNAAGKCGQVYLCIQITHSAYAAQSARMPSSAESTDFERFLLDIAYILQCFLEKVFVNDRALYEVYCYYKHTVGSKVHCNEYIFIIFETNILWLSPCTCSYLFILSFRPVNPGCLHDQRNNKLLQLVNQFL